VIQLATMDNTYVIDALALEDEPEFKEFLKLFFGSKTI
jgi:hypothetical protein